MHENSVRWLGHSTFEITTGGGTKILIDPWITGNPRCPVEAEDVADVDIVLITHDHHDHMGDDLALLAGDEKTDILVQPEVAAKLADMGVDGATGMNIGGTVEISGIGITMVQAFHSSSAGFPCGFIVTTEDGKRIYHAGDTGIFSTMQTLGDIYDLDVALLPIGSHFVMDPEQAAHAVRLLKPDFVVPMHFGTFPVLVETPDAFLERVAQLAPDAEVRVLEPGDAMKF